MFYGFSLKRIHEGDVAYAEALVEMLQAGDRHQQIAAELGQPAETAKRLVETVAAVAETVSVQGPVDRSTPDVTYPYPHRNGA